MANMQLGVRFSLALGDGGLNEIVDAFHEATGVIVNVNYKNIPVQCRLTVESDSHISGTAAKVLKNINSERSETVNGLVWEFHV